MRRIHEAAVGQSVGRAVDLAIASPSERAAAARSAQPRVTGQARRSVPRRQKVHGPLDHCDIYLSRSAGLQACSENAEGLALLPRAGLKACTTNYSDLLSRGCKCGQIRLAIARAPASFGWTRSLCISAGFVMTFTRTDGT